MIELTVITPPAGALIPLPDVKQHLRVDHDADDALISALVEAARQHIENVMCWQSFSPRTLRANYDTWDGVQLWLPFPPVTELVEVAIVTDETLGTRVIFDPAHMMLDSNLGRVRFSSEAFEAAGAAGRMVAEYETGYATLPPWARAAVLLLVGHLYENRESVVVGAGVSAIDIPFSVQALAAANQAWRPGGAI